MLVKCVCNDIRRVDSGSELGQELRNWFGTDAYEMNLKVDQFYVVYAVAAHDGWLRYYVADDLYSRTGYPFGYFAAFFDVVDKRVSRCWTMGYQGVSARSPEILVTFEEWSRDPVFYERLVDGADLERGVFRERKEFMDLEFPNPAIADSAGMLDGGWLLCPRCGEAWESQAVDGMIRCPKCRTLLLNPRFASGT